MDRGYSILPEGREGAGRDGGVSKDCRNVQGGSVVRAGEGSRVSGRDALEPLVAALDLGSSSVRALVFDARGRMVEGSLARRAVRFRSLPDGRVEAGADGLVEGAFSALDECLAGLGKETGKIAAVATCSFVTNILGVDEGGRALTPVSTYADTRAAKEAEELAEFLDLQAYRERTGCLFHPSYLPARFLWWKKRAECIFRTVKRWVSLGEYMHLRLFGDAKVSFSAASWSGLLDRKHLEWDRETLEVLPIGPENLSPLCDLDEPARGLRGGFRDRWPSLAEVPWFPAVGDGAAANVGTGCLGPDRAALTMGTSTALRVILPGREISPPPGLWAYLVDRNRSLLGGALTEGGSIHAWMKDVLRLPRDFEEKASGLPPGAGGVTVLPLLGGERSPGWASRAFGVAAGLTFGTGPVELARAFLEGVSLRAALVYRALVPFLEEGHQVVAGGGALQASPLWRRITADALGAPLVLSRVEEPSARGAALLALKALGVLEDLSRVPASPGEVLEPDPEAGKAYEEILARQEEIYRKFFL